MRSNTWDVCVWKWNLWDLCVNETQFSFFSYRPADRHGITTFCHFHLLVSLFDKSISKLIKTLWLVLLPSERREIIWCYSSVIIHHWRHCNKRWNMHGFKQLNMGFHERLNEKCKVVNVVGFVGCSDFRKLFTWSLIVETNYKKFKGFADTQNKKL
jgi:hypothetical protein